MQNARLDESQDGIKTARRKTNNFRHADETTHMAQSEEEPKSLLMRVKEEGEKAGLKLYIQKTSIMASDLTTSWQTEGVGGEEAVTDFIFLGSKITVDGDCGHEIKTPAPWKESYDKRREHIKKQRHHFADRGPCNQSYGFFSSHIWTWELDPKEGWVPKNRCFRIVVLEKTWESLGLQGDQTSPS